MSWYDLRCLLGVPGGSHKIMTTLKGIWGYWRAGSFFSGPRCLVRFWKAGRFWEGTKRVSGGSDGSENLKSLLEYHIMT